MLDKDTRDEINEMINDKISRVNSRIYEIEVKQTVLENTTSGRWLKPRNSGYSNMGKASSGYLEPLLVILIALIISLFLFFITTHDVTIILDGQRIDILPS